MRLSCRDADGSGRTSDRDTEPHGLVHTGSRWYLAAFDLDRDDWRTFRLDRIDGNVGIGSRFTPREIPEGDAASYVSRSVASTRHRYRARVVFHAPLARVRERIPPAAGHLRKVDAHRCRLEAGADTLWRLALFVSLIGEDFEVEDPPSSSTNSANSAPASAEPPPPASPKPSAQRDDVGHDDRNGRCLRERGPRRRPRRQNHLGSPEQ